MVHTLLGLFQFCFLTVVWVWARGLSWCEGVVWAWRGCLGVKGLSGREGVVCIVWVWGVASEGGGCVQDRFACMCLCGEGWYMRLWMLLSMFTTLFTVCCILFFSQRGTTCVIRRWISLTCVFDRCWPPLNKWLILKYIHCSVACLLYLLCIHNIVVSQLFITWCDKYFMLLWQCNCNQSDKVCMSKLRS